MPSCFPVLLHDIYQETEAATEEADVREAISMQATEAPELAKRNLLYDIILNKPIQSCAARTV